MSLFASASGKKISISKAQIEKAKAFLGGSEDCGEKTNERLGDTSSSLFQSASGRKISISKAQMDKAKQLLGTTEDTIKDSEETKDTKPSLFQSAAGKQIEVSEKQLDKAKKLLAKASDQPSSLFQSGSGKAINISPTKLKQAKRRMSEMLPPPSKPPETTRQPKSLHQTFKTPAKRRRASYPSSSSKYSAKAFKPPKTLQTPGKTPTGKKTPIKHPATPSIPTPNPVAAFQNKHDTKKYHYLQLHPSCSIMAEDLNSEMLRCIQSNCIVFDLHTNRPIPPSLSRPETMDSQTLYYEMVRTELLPSSITFVWFENHVKRILFKCFWYEALFEELKHKFMNMTQIKHQILKRYKTEKLLNQRSCLHRILNRDDSSARSMILSVVDIPIATAPNDPRKLVLSDGWYAIECQVDEHLAKLIDAQKIQLFTKLVLFGAKLLNCDGGIEPLECQINNPRASQVPYLSISINGTRKAKWRAKLGYLSNDVENPVVLPLASVVPNGGLIHAIACRVDRVSELMFFDPQLRKYLSHVQKDRQQEEYFEKRRACAQAGKKVDEEALQRPELKPIVQLTLSCIRGPAQGNLSVWNPPEDYNDTLKEGQIFYIFHIHPSTQLQTSTGVKVLRLNTTRSTIWKNAPEQLEACSSFVPRHLTTLKSIYTGDHERLGRIDVCAYVVRVKDFSSTTVQLFCTDFEAPQEVVTRVLLIQCELEYLKSRNSIKTGSIIALRDLQLKHFDQRFQVAIAHFSSGTRLYTNLTSGTSASSTKYFGEGRLKMQKVWENDHIQCIDQIERCHRKVHQILNEPYPTSKPSAGKISCEKQLNKYSGYPIQSFKSSSSKDNFILTIDNNVEMYSLLIPAEVQHQLLAHFTGTLQKQGLEEPLSFEDMEIPHWMQFPLVHFYVDPIASSNTTRVHLVRKWSVG